jgi:adenylate cyclase
VIASEATVALAGDGFAWRELDAVRVKGRMQPLKIFELLAPADGLTDHQKAANAHYAEGLAHWRTGKFDLAAACFERTAKTDRPAAIFLERAKQFAANPPATEWDSIRTLESK